MVVTSSFHRFDCLDSSIRSVPGCCSQHLAVDIKHASKLRICLTQPLLSVFVLSLRIYIQKTWCRSYLHSQPPPHATVPSSASACLSARIHLLQLEIWLPLHGCQYPLGPNPLPAGLPLVPALFSQELTQLRETPSAWSPVGLPINTLFPAAFSDPVSLPYLQSSCLTSPAIHFTSRIHRSLACSLPLLPILSPMSLL